MTAGRRCRPLARRKVALPTAALRDLCGQEVAGAVRELSADVRILFVSGYAPDPTKRALNEPLLRKP